MASGVGAVGAKNTLTSMRKRPSGGGVGGDHDQDGEREGQEGVVELLDSPVSEGVDLGFWHNPGTVRHQFGGCEAAEHFVVFRLTC